MTLTEAKQKLLVERAFCVEEHDKLPKCSYLRARFFGRIQQIDLDLVMLEQIKGP